MSVTNGNLILSIGTVHKFLVNYSMRDTLLKFGISSGINLYGNTEPIQCFS